MLNDICRVHFHMWSNRGDRNKVDDRSQPQRQRMLILAGSEKLNFRISLSYSIGEGNIVQTVLLPFLSAFSFSMPSKVMILVIQSMFLGVNIFSTLPRAHFNPRLTARAKISLSQAQNIFMPANINFLIMALRFRLMCLSCLTA